MKAASDPLSLALRAVSEPARRKILRLLSSGSVRRGARGTEQPGWTASEIEQKIKLAQPTVSHHLKILKNAGLIESQKQGTWVRFRRVESALRALRKSLAEEI
jgi:ArsR family transcriptional regulator